MKRRTGRKVAGRKVVFRAKRGFNLRSGINSIVPLRKFVVETYQHNCSAITLNHANYNYSQTSNCYGSYGTFRTNSPYDPLYAVSGVGNVKASLHGYMSQWYNTYRVLWSEVEVTFRQVDYDSTRSDIGCILRCDDDATWPTQSWPQACQDPANVCVVMKCVTPNRDGLVRIKRRWSPRRRMDPREANYDVAAYNYSPGREMYWILGSGAPSQYGSDEIVASGDNGKLEATIKIRYGVVWYDRKDFSGNSGVVLPQS